MRGGEEIQLKHKGEERGKQSKRQVPLQAWPMGVRSHKQGQVRKALP